MMKVLEDNIEDTMWDVGVSNDFLYKTSHARQQKQIYANSIIANTVELTHRKGNNQ